MKNKFKILLLPILLVFAFTNANAKWWIFGQNESSVDISYLYINSLSFDSTKKELVISKDSLDNGYIHIRGKANAGSSNIGRVLITLDGKKTWQKAKLTGDGAFDFSFKPELNKKYNIYVQILDTTGKSNDMEDTHKIISVSNKNMREIVQASLNHLKQAYSNEDFSGFMKYVSGDFTGDDTTLELALRKDFTVFDNIQINFTINSIAYQDGRYMVSVSFNRSLESAKDGKVYTDSGITEFSFVDGKNGAMLYSMKNPLIFGLSDASEVADGSVVTTENTKVITTDSTGDISKKSIVDIVNNTEDDDEGGANNTKTLDGGIVTLNALDSSLYQGFVFSTESKVTNGAGDINPSPEPPDAIYFTPANGACIVNLAGNAPCDPTTGTPGLVGDTFEVHLANGDIVQFKLLSYDDASLKIDWSYK